MSQVVNKNISALSSLFVAHYGVQPLSLTRLPGAGGDRVYFRIKTETISALGVVADSNTDAEAFIKLTRCFLSNDIRVPQVISWSDDYRYYLVEDLGDESLFTIIKSDKDSHRVEALVKETLRMLTSMQTINSEEWENIAAYKPFSLRQIMWDLNYFKYDFLKPAEVYFDEDLLENDLESLASSLIDIPQSQWGFMMRDCQSRNVMVRDEYPWFIDYQGGRFGPGIYDAVSFLWQAKAGFSDEFRHEMLHYYADEFSERRGIPSNEILIYAPCIVLFRTLQVLGAYGFRGLIQKRAHFIESIPPAIENLSGILDSFENGKFPELRNICRRLKNLAWIKKNENKQLIVKVFSFSYKKGYPQDYSGNGGGFMFDCRGMHNPGRYDEYKSLTGRDKPVIDFLKDRGEADKFVQQSFNMVSPVVDRYLQRGFNSLQVGFGCTGGQHRSVYCAENVAREIKNAYPMAVVELIHREQNITEIL